VIVLILSWRRSTVTMEDSETQTTRFNEQTPLLRSDAQIIAELRARKDFIDSHILSIHGEDSWLWKSRRSLQGFLTSKWGHYSVITLVSLDIAGIFANFLISLHVCEHSGEKGFNKEAWIRTEDALDVLSLVFSCAFMLELCLSVWALGWVLATTSPASKVTSSNPFVGISSPSSTSLTPRSLLPDSLWTYFYVDPLRKRVR
jgi:hypothetical protein